MFAAVAASGFSRKLRTSVRTPGWTSSGIRCSHNQSPATSAGCPAPRFSRLRGSKRRSQQANIFARTADDVVRGKDAHDRIGIDRLEHVGRQTNRRSGVALCGLRQDLALRNFGKLLDDFGAQMIVSQDPDALGRNYRTQAVDGLLDQGPFARKSQDLLGVRAAAPGPESSPTAARQNQAIQAFSCTERVAANQLQLAIPAGLGEEVLARSIKWLAL